MYIKSDARTEEDGVGLLHFGRGEETEAFVKAEVEMLWLGGGEGDEIMPDAVAAETAVQPPIIAMYRMCQNQLHLG